MEFFKKIGWTKVASLTQEGDQYSGYVSELQDYLQTHGIDFVINRKFQESAINTPEADMSMVSLMLYFSYFSNHNDIYLIPKSIDYMFSNVFFSI